LKSRGTVERPGPCQGKKPCRTLYKDMASNQIANVQYAMGGQGTIMDDSDCGTIIFLTHIYAYEVSFGGYGEFKIQRVSVFDDDPETVLFSGTLGEVVNTLNLVGPFLN